MKTMLEPETILELLGESLSLMTALLPELTATGGESPATPAIRTRYRDFLNVLSGHRSDDPRLADEGWSWIWQENKGELSPLQLYGRLAFINSELFHLM